jgi:polyisoprenoid-binding protein YceI
MLWTIDPAHSEINFAVRHMMISNVRGRFEKFTGVVDFNEQNPIESKVEVKIDAASINTREPNRDAHLRSPDFLDVEKYPYITYKSDHVEVLDEHRGKIFGEMTIKDVTRPVTLDVTYSGQAKSPWGTTSAGFTAHTVLNRKNWNLTWNKALETGGMLVGDDMRVDIELEIVKQPEVEKALSAA